jgi:hypothetical protein
MIGDGSVICEQLQRFISVTSVSCCGTLCELQKFFDCIAYNIQIVEHKLLFHYAPSVGFSESY